MDNEKNLTSPNYGSALSGLAGATSMAIAARKGPKWLRYLLFVFIAITLFTTAAGLIANLAGIGSIPECDAKQTRDTLSDLNKQNKLNASKYNFIKKVSTSELETTCTANLAVSGGGTVRIRLSHLQGGLEGQGADYRY